MAGWVVLVEVVEVVGVVEVVDDGVVDDGGVDDGVIGLAVSHEASRTAATAAKTAKRFTIDPFIAEDRDSSVPVAASGHGPLVVCQSVTTPPLTRRE